MGAKNASGLVSRGTKLLRPLLFPMIATFAGFVVGGIIIAANGHDPFSVIWGLISGGFGSPHALTTTLTRSTPIILAGLSAALAWGSGYESMGAAGQMIMGAFTAAIVAVRVPGPPWMAVAAALLAGMLAGMLYSLVSAYISDRFEVYLLIATLMMNYIADNFADYMTTYVFRDPDAADRLAVQTQKITAVLPRIFPGYTLHYGFVIALAAVGVMAFIMKKTSFGYKARMGGLNAKFALYGGVNAKRTMYMTLLLSGALAGLGGAVEVLGARFRYIDGMITSTSYAWSGITASLMSSNNPIGVFVSSVFLAGLTTGGGSVELKMHVPSEITTIIQGVLTMFVTAKFAIDMKRRKKKTVETAKEGG